MDQRNRLKLLRAILKALNGTISSISNLERDPPIVRMANLQRSGELNDPLLLDMQRDLMMELKKVNDYRSHYWKLENSIKQSFLSYMRKKGYLPSISLEIDSLKNGLPEALIRDDPRIWVFSYDQYIGAIANRVGRKMEHAPKGQYVWDHFEKKYQKSITDLLKVANDCLPGIYHMKTRIRAWIKEQEKEWPMVHVKRPRITPIERPIRKTVVIKRPLPLPKQKMPRKKVLKKPEFHEIGPEEGR
ncbi:MAG: hypothetical protein ACMUHB_06355 [Thermoplasmatota archaeon]